MDGWMDSLLMHTIHYYVSYDVLYVCYNKLGDQIHFTVLTRNIFV